MYVEWVILSFAVSAWEIRRFVHISSCGWINALFCFCSSICLWNKKIKKQLLKILCRMVDKYLPGCLGTLKKALFIRWLMHEAFCRPFLGSMCLNYFKSCHNSKHFFFKVQCLKTTQRDERCFCAHEVWLCYYHQRLLTMTALFQTISKQTQQEIIRQTFSAHHNNYNLCPTLATDQQYRHFTVPQVKSGNTRENQKFFWSFYFSCFI